MELYVSQALTAYTGHAAYKGSIDTHACIKKHVCIWCTMIWQLI